MLIKKFEQYSHPDLVRRRTHNQRENLINFQILAHNLSTGKQRLNQISHHQSLKNHNHTQITRKIIIVYNHSTSIAGWKPLHQDSTPIPFFATLIHLTPLIQLTSYTLLHSWVRFGHIFYPPSVPFLTIIHDPTILISLLSPLYPLPTSRIFRIPSLLFTIFHTASNYFLYNFSVQCPIFTSIHTSLAKHIERRSFVFQAKCVIYTYKFLHNHFQIWIQHIRNDSHSMWPMYVCKLYSHTPLNTRAKQSHKSIAWFI